MTHAGQAPGAASPSASSASATRPARTRGGRVSSLFGFGLGAYFDELHPRGAAARALARQDGIDHLEAAGQAAPGRGALHLARAQRACFVGHAASCRTVYSALARLIGGGAKKTS